jgi:hypothetical protein
VLGTPIPVGVIPEIATSYSNGFRTLGSLDYNPSETDQWRGRFVQNRTSSIDTGASLASFWTQRPTTAYLASLSEFHTFGPSALNEVRVAFTRYNDRRTAPGFNFPGLDTFPTLSFVDLGLTLGPLDIAPQITVQNNYQIADNFTWNVGRHDFKFGFDGRDAISTMDFLQRARGEYRYNTLNRYLRDQTPDTPNFGRLVGGKPYSGNALYYYLYANDTWRVTRRLTLNLGVRWEYNGIPKSMKEQALNSLSDIPGVIEFRAPKAQLSNFAPRFGFAYAPGNSGRTSIRGGFGIAYDQIFDNIGTNVRSPQTGGVLAPPQSNPNAAFLATGAVPNVATPVDNDPEWSRFYTTGYIPDQKLGYALSWNLGIQRSFGKDWVVDVRYLGTRGVHLLLQTQLNRLAIVTPTNSLPTYLTAPSQQDLDALPLTLTQLQNQAKSNNPYAQYGFSSAITAYTPEGASIYHGLAIDVNKRFSRQLLFKGAYTWSHARDNSTAEINTTSLTPRRPQDFNNLKPEWSDSSLDRRHRLTLAWVWDAPWFRQSSNGWVRNVLGNYSFSGSYTAESPQYVTPQSAIDANMNGDNVSDRVIVNPNGTPGVGSDVTALKNTGGQTVGYVANNPNAYYLVARQGAYANSGRNILATNGINNFDLGVTKSFSWSDNRRLEFRGDFFNAFNHSQYTPGRTNNVASSPYTSSLVQMRPSNADFGKWDRLFSNNARNIQLVAKFIF